MRVIKITSHRAKTEYGGVNDEGNEWRYGNKEKWRFAWGQKNVWIEVIHKGTKKVGIESKGEL